MFISPPTPPRPSTSLPIQLLSSHDFKHIKSDGCCSVTLGFSHLSEQSTTATPLERTESPSLSSYHLPIAPQLGVGLLVHHLTQTTHTHTRARVLGSDFSVYRSCACFNNFCDFICAKFCCIQKMLGFCLVGFGFGSYFFVVTHYTSGSSTPLFSLPWYFYFPFSWLSLGVLLLRAGEERVYLAYSTILLKEVRTGKHTRQGPGGRS